MTSTPLNPDALEKACKSIWESRGNHPRKWENTNPETAIFLRSKVIKYVSAYLAVAQPVVSSVEELDALPPHTVIEEHEQGHGVLIKRGPRSWECLTHYVSGLPSGDIDLPARVLYRPEAKP